MSQQLIPLDGGTSSIVTSSPQQGIYLSRQFVETKGLESRPTEWNSTGRPIYDRLPSASEAYRLFPKGGENEAFVFIPSDQTREGRGTLNVTTSGGGKFLAIQAGKIVWKGGTIPLEPVIMNLEELGMWNTKYVLAYRLYYTNSPQVFQYSVSSYSLEGSDMRVESGTDSVMGWRYQPGLAFLGNDTRPWRNRDELFPLYEEEGFIQWQTPYPCSFSRIVLRSPKVPQPPASATLSFMSCPLDTEEGLYCENPTWIPQFVTEPKEDETGTYYEFTIPEPTFLEGWRIEWSDPNVSIYSVLVDGTVSLRKRPSEGFSVCELVAYPENSVPDTFLSNEGVEIMPVYCNLAYVEVNKFFTATKVTDLRVSSNTDFVPVADWLTLPWDENLSQLFKTFGNFTKLWMDPVSSMGQEYLKLSSEHIKLKP